MWKKIFKVHDCTQFISFTMSKKKSLHLLHECIVAVCSTHNNRQTVPSRRGVVCEKVTSPEYKTCSAKPPASERQRSVTCG